MTLIELAENGLSKPHRFTPGQVDALKEAKFVGIEPVSGGGGLWKLKGKGVIGTARIGPPGERVTVRIQPKLPIERLLFLIGYANHLHGWQEEEVDAAQQPDLLPAVAHAFARAAERTLRQGVLLGYREKHEALPVVRGRIQESVQIGRRYGLPLPVEVRYDDFTVDIPENRLLLTAALRLLCLPGVHPATRSMLRRLILRLDGVRPHTHGTLLPRWTPSRLNARYRTALRLAELILRSGSYEHEDGTVVRVDGLLLTMWKVFEDFLTRALQEALRPYGGRTELQDESRHLDHDRRIQLKPDLVYYTPAGPPGAVLDAKYTFQKELSKRQEHLYQVLAYCTAFQTRRGYLVYAQGPNAPQTHRISGAEDIQLTETALNLDVPIPQLRAQITRLARDLAGAAVGPADRRPLTEPVLTEAAL